MSKVWLVKLLFWVMCGGPAMAGWYIDGARVSQDELDPVYSANQYAVNMDQGVSTLDMVDFAGVSVNGTPVVVVGGNVSLLANDAGYLAVESDPVFSAAQAGLGTLAGEQSFTGAKTFDADLKLGVGSYLLAMGPTEAEGRFLRTGTRAFRFDGYAGSGNKWDFRDVVTLAGRDPASATATGVYLGDTSHSRGAYQFVHNAGGSGEKYAAVLGRSVGTDNNGFRCGVVGMGDHKGKCMGVYGGTAGLRSSDVAYGVVGGDGDFYSTPSGGLLAKARVGVYGYASGVSAAHVTNVGVMAEASGETINIALLARQGDVWLESGVKILTVDSRIVARDSMGAELPGGFLRVWELNGESEADLILANVEQCALQQCTGPISQWNNDTGYLTAETDPVYSLNDHATGMDQDVDQAASPTFAGLTVPGMTFNGQAISLKSKNVVTGVTVDGDGHVTAVTTETIYYLGYE